ncbi:MAG: addiction module protein [Gemmatimonadaceae bacterium]
MNTALAKIEAEALQLTSAERVRLADHLLASVARDPGLEQEWAEEAERRLAEVEAGAPLISLNDAIARARQAIL